MKSIESVGNEIENRTYKANMLNISINVPLPFGVSPFSRRDGIAMFSIKSCDGASVSGYVAFF